MKSRRRTFSLKRFPGEESGGGIGITGSVELRGSVLLVRYAIFGDLSNIAIPPSAERRERRERLWEDTCLECFLAPDGSDGYWEFHFSPAGYWNVYRFEKYRTGMREEQAFRSLPVVAWMEQAELRLSVDIDIGKIVTAGRGIGIGIAAVIRTGTGETSHWALIHRGQRPDFHRTDGFLLRVPLS